MTGKQIKISFIFLIGVIGIAAISPAELAPTLSVPESDIKFSHRLHVSEQEIECEACHAAVSKSVLSRDKNLPTMDDCGSCHDVEDDEQCALCHKNPDDPGELVNPERELIFNHKRHLELKSVCSDCHGGIEKSSEPDTSYLPEKKICSECHDGRKASNDCAVCHSSNLTLAGIHPLEWLHNHGERASSDPQYCEGCHTKRSWCLECHRGDNLSGEIHDLNYVYTHGLDAGGKASDCSHCHDNRAFCVECHESNNRMPLRHSMVTWITDHGRYAREDVENCAACHEGGDPTCARIGCHNDFDGIRGTDTRIHGTDAPQLDYGGPWHGDDGYYCFQCHVSTRSTGGGFCQYCHD